MMRMLWVLENSKLLQSLESKHESLRDGYVPAAIHGRVLYFVLCDMDWINNMYRFSITWFKRTFHTAIKSAERRKDVEERVGLICDSVNAYVFRRVSPALAQFDRLSFALCVCIRFLEEKQSQNFLTTQEIRFLLTHHDTITGADGEDEISEDDDEHEHQITHFQNPAPSWQHYEHWSLLNTLSNTSEYFKDLSMHIVENVEDWESFMLSQM